MTTLASVLPRSSRLALITGVAALALLAPAGSAQTPEAMMDAGAHPVHIHSGTCAELGDVVVP